MRKFKPLIRQRTNGALVKQDFGAGFQIGLNALYFMNMASALSKRAPVII